MHTLLTQVLSNEHSSLLLHPTGFAGGRGGGGGTVGKGNSGCAGVTDTNGGSGDSVDFPGDIGNFTIGVVADMGSILSGYMTSGSRHP